MNSLPVNRKSLFTTLILPITGLLFCTGFILWVDIPLAEMFHSFASSWGVGAFEVITHAGDSKWVLVPSLVVALICWWWKREIARRALFIFAAVAGSGLLANLIKVMACRYRPSAYLGHGFYGFDLFAFVTQYERNSFPSGHATTGLSAAIALGLLMPRFRYFFWVAGVVVAFSRVVVTAHYLSDSLAGSMLGAYWTLWLWKVMEKRGKSLGRKEMERRVEIV